MNAGNSEHKKAGSSMAAFLVQCAVVFAALLFVSGWYYGHAYFGVFGVGLTQLDIPITHYLAWIHPMIFEYWYISLPMLAITVISLVAAHEYLPPFVSASKYQWVRRLDRIVSDPNLLVLIGLFVLLIAFPRIAEKAGDDHGERDLYADTTTLPVADVTLRNPEGDSNVIIRLRGLGVTDGEYSLLGRHRGAIFIVPPQRRTAIGGEIPTVLILPEAVVASIRVRRGP